MTTPNWRAPIATNSYLASDITQFLGTHGITYIYQGASKVSYTVASTGTLNTNTGSAAQWIDQPFTTASGQTTITRVELSLQLQGTGADTTFEIRTDNAGVPSNTAIYTVTLPLDFVTGSLAYLSIPCSVAVSALTKYHIVLDGTSNTTNYLKWGRAATSVNAANVSATGTGSWSTASVTALFNVFAGVDGNVRNTYEDAGARWTGLDYAATGTTAAPPSTIREYTGALRSVRTATLSSGLYTAWA